MRENHYGYPWCVCGGESKSNYGNTIYPKHTLPEFLP